MAGRSDDVDAKDSTIRRRIWYNADTMTEPILTAILTAEIGGLLTIVWLWLRMRESSAVRKRERDSQALEHIKTWAGRVVDWRLKKRYASWQSKRLLTHIEETLDLFLNIHGFGEPVMKVSRTLKHGLPEYVQQLTADIDAFVNCLNQWKAHVAEGLSGAPPVATGFDKGFPVDEVMLDVLDTKMVSSAEKLLERVADIKTTLG